MNGSNSSFLLGDYSRRRAKHAPDNLIRELKQPTAFLANLQPTNPELHAYVE
jgi:hypothetical protein